MLEARTDVVGSLLRPPELLDARERRDLGEHSAPDFKRIEDFAATPMPAAAGPPSAGSTSTPASSSTTTSTCPLEGLAHSLQCGFATSVLGNMLTVENQAAKLRTIAETAARVWG
jgi:hypothetical protein